MRTLTPVRAARSYFVRCFPQQLTTGEVVGRLTKDWAKDLASYDEGHAHMLTFADTLTDGIVKQFPAKFR